MQTEINKIDINSNISAFNPKLIDLFGKMVFGINVELSEKGRKKNGGILTGRWFFITAIGCDERITLQDNSHTILSGLKLSDIK